MVYVTHDQVEAMTMGDRIAVMKDGVIHQLDTPLKLYKEPADLFVASFIGSPSMNFIHTTLKEEPDLIAVDGNIKIDIPSNHKKLLKSHIDKPIIIGIRPEDLSLNPRNEYSVSISLRIDLFEPMGNETLIYLSREDTRLTCRTPEFQPEADLSEELIIYLNMDKALYFDTETGKSIR